MGHRFFRLIMLLVLFIIGVLQFFELPKIIDYIFLVIAIVFGVTALYKKFYGLVC